MSKFTTTVDNLQKSNFNMGLTINDYPIFDEAYRNTLNQKIIDHYRYREIGFSTPEMFRFYLNRTLREIMPLYNQYYKQAAIEFNPYYTKDYTETYTKTIKGNLHNEGESTANGDGKSNNKNHGFLKDFNTPNAPITEIDNYISEAKQTDETLDKTYEDNSKGTSKSDSNSETTETFTHTNKGIDNVLTADAILKYRKTFINIDMMIINELSSCFMNIY